METKILSRERTGYIKEVSVVCDHQNLCLFFFFFKQKTAYEIGTGDWSSDVCSSDLAKRVIHTEQLVEHKPLDFCLDVSTGFCIG